MFYIMIHFGSKCMQSGARVATFESCLLPPVLVFVGVRVCTYVYCKCVISFSENTPTCYDLKVLFMILGDANFH